jgi:hypothetical protein
LCAPAGTRKAFLENALSPFWGNSLKVRKEIEWEEREYEMSRVAVESAQGEGHRNTL